MGLMFDQRSLRNQVGITALPGRDFAMRQIFAIGTSMSWLFLVLPEAYAQSTAIAPLPAPVFTITLGSRDACVTPQTRMRARADGGIIDVQSKSPDALNITMTGAPAADSYLGCTSAATQTFHLVQEFEVSCSDPSVEKVSLVLDSTLVGYARSTRKAAAGVRLASATIVSSAQNGGSVELVHPPLQVSGTQGRLCNQHLEPVHSPALPLGRLVLTAEFVLDTTASGVCNAHAAADFSPDTTLPAEWVRMRDPFQGVSKTTFGFHLSVTARGTLSPRAPASAADSGRSTRAPGPLRSQPLADRSAQKSRF
jgi:hypothetical protein